MNAKVNVAAETKKYKEFKAKNLKLDMSRGKPEKAQLDLSNGLFDTLSSQSKFTYAVDYRNYGIVDGIPEAKLMFSALAGVGVEEIMVLGNASLNIMYDTLQRAMQFGVLGHTPFNKQEKIKWLCPVPGYDRHFAITELFGIEMINVPMQADGPDMNVVELLVKDESVKGIWCVPKYSNPQGVVYSDEVVTRFAKLQPAAKDFRIYWDNAYAIHRVFEDVPILNLLDEAEKYENEDMVYMFGSTSKVTQAGAGVSYICASEANISALRKLLSIQTIGPDKINQLAHCVFFDFNAENIIKHMDKHAKILKPKFEKVLQILAEELTDIAQWLKPNGGYFVSVELPEGTAKRTVELAKEAGVVFTEAGATYPYKNDPKDSNVRIAPSFPPIAELETAMRVFCCCAKIAYAEKYEGK